MLPYTGTCLYHNLVRAHLLGYSYLGLFGGSEILFRKLVMLKNMNCYTWQNMLKKRKREKKKQAERARIALYHKQVSLTSLVKISYIVVHEIHIHIHPGVIPWPSCDQHATGYENYDHLYISCQLLYKPAQCFSDLPRTQPCSINHQVGQQAQVL